MAKYKVFACEVLFREICLEAANTSNIIDLCFNHFGLHHAGSEGMVRELQQLVNSVAEDKYDAILFGYGLCNNGIVGLKSRGIPIVMPRAHDCITLLLGSKEKYEEEFNKEPGTYYHSPGWLEHHNLEDDEDAANKLGTNMSYEEMVEKYGEENANYLKDTISDLGTFEKNYTRLAYVDTGVGPRDELISQSRITAADNGWELDLLPGSRTLIRKMLDGEWDQNEFLVVNPGQVIKPTYDKMIIGVE